MNKQTRNILVFIAIFVVLAGGFYYLSFKSASEKISGKNKKIKELDAKLAKADEYRQKIALLSQEIDDLELALKFAKETLPAQEEITLLIDDVNKLGTVESNISITEFTPQKQIPREIYYEKPYSMRIVGSFHQIATFFNKIGNLNRIINVENLSLSLGKNNYEVATFTLKTYSYHEGKAAGPAAAKRRGR